RSVDAEVDAAGPQGGRDPGEHEVRPRLVVHRVKGGDEVEPGVLVEAGGVTLLEARVRQAAACGLGAGGRDPGFREVEASEPRPGKRRSHKVDGVAGPAANV